jgi:hypothetical protein
VTSHAKRARFGLPGNGRVALEIGDRGDVGIARHLPDLAGGEAREAGALLQEAVERLARADGTSFALGRAYMSTNCANTNSTPRACMSFQIASAVAVQPWRFLL